MTAWLKFGVGVGALALLAGPQSGFCGRRGASDRRRVVSEPGVLVLPAGGGQCWGDQRSPGRARSRV